MEPEEIQIREQFNCLTSDLAKIGEAIEGKRWADMANAIMHLTRDLAAMQLVVVGLARKS
jgi:hypothetical protein